MTARGRRRDRRRHDRRQGARRRGRRREVARAEREYPLSHPQPGWAEQDPEDWWRATEAALAELGDSRSPGIGLSGQMHGLVTLDEHEQVLRPAILWNDQRTAAECAEIEERVGLERLIELTGNRALTGFTAPKLLWLRTHEPETVRPDRARAAAEGLRAAAAHRRAGDRRRGRLRHAALRRREPPLARQGAGRARAAGRVAAARRTSRRRSRAGRRRHRWPPGRATRPPRRSASASTGRGRSRSCSAPPASSSPRCPRTRPSRRRASTSSVTPSPAAGTRWA